MSAVLPPLVGGGFPIAALQLCSVYYVGALAVHLLIPWCVETVTPVARNARKPSTPQQRKAPAAASPGQILRECLMSLGPIAVKASVFCTVDAIHERGLGLLYDGALAPPGTSLLTQALIVGATVIALDLLHDTWFYFTHLLMHKNRWLLVNVHSLHHRSRVPTPFSGYSLHVIEAVIVFFDEIIVCFVLPIHVKLHRLYHLYTTLIHIGGHASYELHPLVPSLEQALWIAFNGDAVSRVLNTVLYHNLHHQFPNKNLSLYFTHWDTLLGTRQKDYHEEMRALKAKQRGTVMNREGSTSKGDGGGGGLARYYTVLVLCMGGTLALSVAAYLASYHSYAALVSKKT